MAGTAQWYRRAYFDDGTPLGSAANAECRIDSIAQSWAVISGAADPARAAQAMAAVDEQLVRRDERARPPVHAALRPHRPSIPATSRAIRPGIRENGGQYTHAAIWSVIAFAMLGDGDKAARAVLDAQPDPPREHPRGRRTATRSSPTSSAADVYAEPPHVGRGGWTWYTGSAGWMYRAGIEWLLGFRVRAPYAHFDPCIPRHWPGFELDFRHGTSRYEVTVDNPRGVTRGIAAIEHDGTPLPAGSTALQLSDDGATHRVRIVLG